MVTCVLACGRVVVCLLIFQQIPGFFVLLVETSEGLALALGKKTDGMAASEFFDGNDVPEIDRCDETDDKINFVNGVVGGTTSFAKTSHNHLIAEPAPLLGVLAVRLSEGGFHLDAEQAASVLNEEVVGMAVPVGFGDADALARRAIHEGEFCELSAALGAVMVLVQSFKSVTWHGVVIVVSG